MPETVYIKSGRNAGPHEIYSRQEADELSMAYVPWREAKCGDWCLTDDDFVMEVFWQALNKGRNMIRNVRGTFMASPGLKCLNEPRDCRSTYTGKKYMDRFYFSTRLKAWAVLVAHGSNPEKAYTEIFGTTSKKYVAERVKLLLAREEVIEFMKSELKPILEKLGITQEFVIKGYLDMFKESENEHVRFKVLNEMALLTGVKETDDEDPTKGKFLGFGDVLDAIEAGQETRAALPAPEDDDQPQLSDVEETHAEHRI